MYNRFCSMRSLGCCQCYSKLCTHQQEVQGELYKSQHSVVAELGSHEQVVNQFQQLGQARSGVGCAITRDPFGGCPRGYGSCGRGLNPGHAAYTFLEHLT